MKQYALPAVYVSVATPGGIAPDRMRVGLLDYLKGAKPPSSPKEHVQYLEDAEQRALATLNSAPPAGWWMSYCPRTDFDPAQAVTFFMADAQHKPGLLALLCASQSAADTSPGVFKLTVDFDTQIAERQAASGAAFDGNGAFSHLCG
jgi:hypothetical protein